MADDDPEGLASVTRGGTPLHQLLAGLVVCAYTSIPGDAYNKSGLISLAESSRRLPAQMGNHRRKRW